MVRGPLYPKKGPFEGVLKGVYGLFGGGFKGLLRGLGRGKIVQCMVSLLFIFYSCYFHEIRYATSFGLKNNFIIMPLVFF